MKIFCKDKFLTKTNLPELYRNGSSWPDKCHGRIVEGTNIPIVNEFGFTSSYGIMKEWCIDSKPLVEYFKKENVAIHVGDGWEFNAFMKMLGEAGVHWASGGICREDFRPELITDFTFKKNRVKVKTSDAEERCVKYVAVFGDGFVTQGSVEYFKRLEGNDKVLEYSDFINLGYKLEKLETGATIPDNITYHMGARGCGKSRQILSTLIDELSEDKIEPVGFKGGKRPSIFSDDSKPVCLEMKSLEDGFSFKLTPLNDPFEEIRKSIHQGLVDGVMNQPYDIHISSDGKTTTARFYVNGKVVREAEAKYHPEDRFNFHTGAEVAFDRLWEKQPKEQKSDEEKPKLDMFDLHVGDKVRVKKDLVVGKTYNYGLSTESFIGMMDHLRGEVVTIDEVFHRGDGSTEYKILEHALWWTPQMFEEV